MRGFKFVILVFGWLTSSLAAQQPDMAGMLLNAARKAYDEKNYTEAVRRFNEFLQKYGNHAEANSARYGLGLAALEVSPQDLNTAINQFQFLAGQGNFPDRPYATYYLASAHRLAGNYELSQMASKPNEAQQRRANAAGRFAEAARWFAEAGKLFSKQIKPATDPKSVPPELDWFARCIADQAEMELRQLKPKEAQTTALPFTKDAELQKSRYRNLGLYYYGYASFLLGELPAAARSLNRVEIFADPIFGSHSRFLVGRIFQQSGEYAEAATQFEAVLESYNKVKAEAVTALQRPELARDNPDEKARLENLVKSPPDYVAQAAFFSAVLLYQSGKFNEAIRRFDEFTKNFPGHPRIPEATLHLGFCQVQIKQYPEAIKTLQPIVNATPNLADQALFFIGKALVGQAEGAKAQQTLQNAAATFRQAAERANQLSQADPDARVRRAEILLELADVLPAAGSPRDAAGIYEQILNEKALPLRSDEITQRLIAALHLTGNYQRSEQLAEQFVKDYPSSPLLPAVLFRRAEGAFLQAQAANGRPEQPKLYEEARKRYQTVIERFPEYERVSLARYGVALISLRRNEYDLAEKALDAIPQPDRTGELVAVPLLLADCLLRQAPAVVEDALAAGQLQEKLTKAIGLLDGFVTSDPKSPLAADAMLKLGYCHQRAAGLLSQPQERNNALQASRTTYEKLIQQFPQSPLVPQSIFERAKVLALQGDKGGATNELRKFTTAPLANAFIAPMAVIQLATLMREQNQAEAAARLLGEARQQHEGKLASDPQRASWVGLLKYHQGICLLEANKYPEARSILEEVARLDPRLEVTVEGALRAGQARIREIQLALEKAKERASKPNLKPDELASAKREIEAIANQIRDAAAQMEQRADAFKANHAQAPARARLYYEAAWAYRLASQHEAPPPPPVRKLPPKKVIEPTTSGKKALDMYRSLISDFAEAPLANEARLELAELLAASGDHEAAIKTLQAALDKEPPAELTLKIRLRLGACLFESNQFESALTQFEAISANPKSPLAAQGFYRAGECLLALKKPQEAIARLAVFRDRGEFHHIAGVSDRGLLQLGYALGLTQQWQASRQAYETLTGRFGNSPWVHDARYGMAWAHQNLKQYDEACRLYEQVRAATATELGAKALLQIGLCRLNQNRYDDAIAALTLIPDSYDYPELSAAARCELGRVYVEKKQPDLARKYLELVLSKHANSEWAKVAKERLDALK